MGKFHCWNLISDFPSSDISRYIFPFIKLQVVFKIGKNHCNTYRCFKNMRRCNISIDVHASVHLTLCTILWCRVVGVRVSQNAASGRDKHVLIEKKKINILELNSKYKHIKTKLKYEIASEIRLSALICNTLLSLLGN
jgi:hypothetical protein